MILTSLQFWFSSKFGLMSEPKSPPFIWNCFFFSWWQWELELKIPLKLHMTTQLEEKTINIKILLILFYSMLFSCCKCSQCCSNWPNCWFSPFSCGLRSYSSYVVDACSLLSLWTENFSLSFPLVPLHGLLSLNAEEPGGVSHLHPYCP